MKWLAPLITICFSLTFITLAKTTTKAEEPRTIEINATKFAFAPNEITIKKGEDVKLVLRSQDADHGLVIEDLGVRAEAKKGGKADVNLNAASAGTFEGRCAHFCGAGHGSMIFVVHVVE
jgi:cytochrome c oxidase subunit II